MLLSILQPIFIVGVESLILEINDINSINSAAKVIAHGLLDYYPGTKYGETIGVFQPPYYWWESGAAWGSMVDYWYYTGDEQYNTLIQGALLSQIGEHWDYVPLNQSTTEGNDDQGIWGLTVMTAAERNFPHPNINGTGDEMPPWIFLAQAVFNTMASRWDTSSCGGGVRWQIFRWNSGYNYKNTVSNGCLFQLAARLARFTNNSTYLEWADRTWNWLESVELVDGTDDYLVVFDGGFVEDDCSELSTLQWSYNAGLLLSGTAFLYEHTGELKWRNRMMQLLNGVMVFFNEGVMFEAACQPRGNCNSDQRSFKAFLSRFLGITAQLAPETTEIIDYYLQQSAIGAAKSCSGGTDGVTCGQNWSYGDWDLVHGLGEQMCALEVIQNLNYKVGPLPHKAGDEGIPQGDPNAGFTRSRNGNTNADPLYIGHDDVIGAVFITLIFSCSIFAGIIYALT